jgi:hypothetical protein
VRPGLAAEPARASSTVPQAWHSPQRPTHLPVSHPHSVQRYADRVRAALPEEDLLDTELAEDGPAGVDATPSR